MLILISARHYLSPPYFDAAVRLLMPFDA